MNFNSHFNQDNETETILCNKNTPEKIAICYKSERKNDKKKNELPIVIVPPR